MTTWQWQANGAVRFEWGLDGSARLGPHADCLVVVDVLSFSTSVSVAVERGTRVFPYPWKDGSAAAYAVQRDAELAVGRRQTTPDRPWSLSPAALRAAPPVPRLVLPSPNGSAIASSDAVEGRTVVAACLRNAAAVGRWLTEHGYGSPARSVAVIAAGEKWPSGALRPALEDALGAGAVISALVAGGAGPLSAEAEAVLRTYAATPDVARAVRSCGSGVELIEGGFGEDVAIAVELGAGEAVPVLRDGAFTDAAGIEAGAHRPRSGRP